MKVIDPGHLFELDVLDNDMPAFSSVCESLRFVKRSGKGYPGNVGQYAGTNMQEVLRACISRGLYVYNQIPDPDTLDAINFMKAAVYALEKRAARRHGRHLVPDTVDNAVFGETCKKCGHVGCKGECHNDHGKI